MAKIGSMMDMGKRSMMNSQTALQTVAHNIANRTTEGYTRQRVDQVTNVPIQEGRLQIGQGARAAQISRINNSFVDSQVQKESSQMSYLNSQTEHIGQVEQVFNEQQNKGLNQYISDFFNSFRELSNNPESVTTRTMVKESTIAMIKDFKRINTELGKVQAGVDDKIRSQAEEINGMAQEVATLNDKIVQVELQGIPANDQRDRRDLLVKKLNEKIDIKVAEGDKGAITISTAGDAILVSGFDAMKLRTYRDGNTGRMNLFYQQSEDHPPVEITNRIRGGDLGGAIQVRDQLVPQMKRKMDELALHIQEEVNKAHLNGFDRLGREASFFFEPLSTAEDASSHLNLSQMINDDVNRIASAAQPGSPGDNTVANVISMVQYKELMDNGTSTMDDFYKSQVGQIGVIASRAIKSKEAQEGILQQANNLRESISGVSLDEEATKMIEYQKAFDASARLIKTADEMFDTVLNLKR